MKYPIAALNLLPVIVTEPGIYKMRNGQLVNVHEVKPNVDKTVTAFTVKGSYKPEGKRANRFAIWHESGAYGCLEQSGRDLIERIQPAQKPVKMLPKIDVFRDDYTGKRSYSFTLYFPDQPANYGHIEYYARMGQHGEASQEFFWHSTIKASAENIRRCHLDIKDLANLMTEWAWLGQSKAEGATPYELVSRDNKTMQSARWKRT